MKAFWKAIGNYFKNLDYILIFLCVAGASFSILLIYSLTVTESLNSIQPSVLKTQVFSLGIGLVAALIIAAIDYKKIAKLWFIYGPIALLLSLLLFTGMGIQREGTDDIGWLNFFGIVTFQPTEVLKVAYILTLSTHINKIKDKLNQPLHLLLVCVHGLAPVALVSTQGDDGSALIFLFMFIFMLFSAGLAWRYIIAGLVMVPVGMWVAWEFIMQAHHKMRFLVIFNPELDTDGRYTYQTSRGLIALGSGQLTGKGLFTPDQTYVPEIYNDFIFSYIGMTLGFLGCFATIILLVFICVKLLANSLMAIDMQGKLICIGVFAMILFQSIVNIGMVLGVVPVIGIPLPFISAGGTSLLSLMISIGLVLSVIAHRTKKKYMFIDKQD